MPYNFVAEVFTQRNFVADSFQAKCNILCKKTTVLRFEPPFEHLRLIGKRSVDFLLVLTELFSLGVTVEAL